MKFAGETPGLCCFNGKVKLPLLTPPPEPLHLLLLGETSESRHFLSKKQQYNSCFQMTSFGAEIIEEHGFNPTFKVIYVEKSKLSSLSTYKKYRKINSTVKVGLCTFFSQK